MSKLRVFLVKGAGSAGMPAPVEEQESITIASEGDTAKKAARTSLADMGYTVRTLSWSPTGGGHELLAYVTKGA